MKALMRIFVTPLLVTQVFVLILFFGFKNANIMLDALRDHYRKKQRVLERKKKFFEATSQRYNKNISRENE